RVRDEKIGLGERLQVRIVLEHAHAHALVAREQLEQLEPRKIDVVVLAARNQHAADLLLDSVRHVAPRSMRRTRTKARKMLNLRARDTCRASAGTAGCGFPGSCRTGRGRSSTP